MFNDEKIYSIELGEDLELPTPSREPLEAVVARPGGPQMSRPPRSKPKLPPKSSPKPASKPPSSGLQFAPLMILTWLLGPFSAHLNPEHRDRKILLAVGMISGVAGLGMFAGRSFILDIIGKGWPLWPWAAAGAVVMVTVFSVWARTAYLTCLNQGVPQHKLPGPFRRAWAIGIAGLIAPGLGLLLAGCARRGAAVLWLAWPVVSAALLLVGGSQIWIRNQGSGGVSIHPHVLENILMVSFLVLLAGMVGWLAQALEGARQMMGEPGIRLRMRGDWYAAALVVVLVTLAFASDPAGLARQLDSAGVILGEKGFQAIPLQLAETAHRLDPGSSEYAVRAIALNEKLGRRDRALHLRQKLDGNLASYLALVNTEYQLGMRQAGISRSDVVEWRTKEEFLGENGPYGGYRTNYQAR